MPANLHESIFDQALRFDDNQARAAFLDRACADQPALRLEVESLLQGYSKGEFLEAPAIAYPPTDSTTADEQLGSRIGRYKLLEKIGEGGMGDVFVAEQEVPVRRKVALKIVKPGMDSRQVLARFEAERQALAMMEHPNIARVFDAGATDGGRPYFVMELVRGVPITEFCDERRLSPHKRLEIFVQVCRAIQHAHQKGVIHRDIKPTNILVTLHDETPVPKVIDFGIAKATGQQLTERTIYTAFSQMIGTPLYMSPEQAEMNALDVDTRSDVYSLGVVLYELLTGATPFDEHALRQAGFDEMRRLIREVDPPRPSQRVSTLDAQAASTVSQRRSIDERRLAGALRGELDWIIMKALEKDRSRRYDSAASIAADVERFLMDETVEACPPSRRYRLGKFVRRHRGPLIAASFVVAALTAMAVTLCASALMVAHQRDQATKHFQLARDAVDEMLTKVATTWVADSASTSKVQRQFLERALAIYQELAKNPPDGDPRGTDAAIAHERIADIQGHLGQSTEATGSLRKAVVILEAASGGALSAHGEPLVRCYRKLAEALATQNDLDGARKVTTLGVDLGHKLLRAPAVSTELRHELVRLLRGRAELLAQQGDDAAAAAVLEQPEAQVTVRADYTGDLLLEDVALQLQLVNLKSMLLVRRGRFDDALETSSVLRHLFLNLPNFADAKVLLELNAHAHEIRSEARLGQKKPDEAVRELRNALRLCKQRLGGRSPLETWLAIMVDTPWRNAEPRAVTDFCNTQLRLAAALPLVARRYEAEQAAGEALVAAELMNDSDPDTLEFWVLRANAASAAGELLAEHGDGESQRCFRLAGALWNETRAQFPNAELFRSGLYGSNRDWEQFRAAHPDDAQRPGTREALAVKFPGSALWNRTLGRAWYQYERWQDAAQHFAKSAELRETDRDYDWLYAAMAYHHMGQADRAKLEYDRAVAEMKTSATVDPELEAVRIAAARLLAENAPVPAAESP